MNNEIEALILAVSQVVAKDIFECGYEPESPTRRIQFMGGKWPDDEREQGGLCEEALVKVIGRSLRAKCKTIYPTT